MYKQTVKTSESPKVILEINGNLALKGWDEPEVEVKCDTIDDLMVEQSGDEVRIICQQDCSVKVPYAARLQVNFVHGNTAIRSIDGEMTIQEASGHVNLRSVGATKIERVHGNLSLDDVDGNATATCDGNVNLNLDPAPGKRYRFEAGGSLICRLPGDASVAVEIREAAQVMISHAEAERAQSAAPYSFTLGDGEAELMLSAKGNVILGSQGWDWNLEGVYFEPGEDFDSMTEEINRQVERQIQAQMEMLEHTLEAQLANVATIFEGSGLSPEKAERVAQKARAASQRAQAKMQRAQEKLQRKLEAARRRAERRARTAADKAARDRRRRTGPEDWTPPVTKPESEPVTDDERLMILRMLEEGQITTQEAEQLLAALEGR